MSHDDAGFPGNRPRGWPGPGLQETFDTPDVLKPPGIEYVRDSRGGLQQLHGAGSLVGPTATAYPQRENRYDCLILPVVRPRLIRLDHRVDPRAVRRDPSQFAAAVCANNLGAGGAVRVKQACGPNNIEPASRRIE
jgi:hypothetical protein